MMRCRTRGQPMQYNHVAIPTTDNFDGEIPPPHLNANYFS